MDMLDAEEFPVEADSSEGDKEKKPRPIIRTAVDLQRLKLEKLMKNPDKPVIIPETPKEKDFLQSVPTFVRNVMGSSAGAGSGEFHVYRHLRRKEYARQKFIQAKSLREQLDDEFQAKLEKNRLDAESKTAKKRAKRQKKKQKMKQRGKKPKTDNQNEAIGGGSSHDSSESEQEESDEGKSGGNERCDNEKTKDEAARKLNDVENSSEKLKDTINAEDREPNDDSEQPNKFDELKDNEIEADKCSPGDNKSD
ncbi:unnamed protein product [Hermetia illucens]|uniref:PRKR-interacting protein 1 n=1 Tax=Hermetia illucens TaxID=343691 RepID=A0A7R8UYN8_HERIL|nr:PRKR-interacting protein 1 homolog [Hermetia illucens]CAD7089427.1 unnamed protein product [Hermetia illucens]